MAECHTCAPVAMGDNARIARDRGNFITQGAASIVLVSSEKHGDVPLSAHRNKD